MLRAWNRLGHLDALVTGGSLPSTGSDGVLMFHSVGDGGFDDMSPARFRSLLERLQESVTFVDLPELFENPSRQRRLVVTFDDGYRGFYDHVVPVLHDLDVPATVFVVGKTLQDQSYVINPGVGTRYMSRDQLAELAADELVTIGNHTLSHPNLQSIASREEIEVEILEAKDVIESELGIEVDRFCYPYNDVSRIATLVVKESHEYGVCGGGWQHVISPRTNPYLIPRVNAAREWWRLRWHLLDRSTHFARSIDEFRSSLQCIRS